MRRGGDLELSSVKCLVAVRKDPRRVEVLRDTGWQLRTCNPERPVPVTRDAGQLYVAAAA